jgi:pimeloyl-ACP methyl ester carboxylesterase
MDSIRRTLLTTGVAAAAAAAARRPFAQSTGKGETAMPFYQKGDVRIHYEEAGSGFPLLLIPGGGLNSQISYLTTNSPFNPIEEFKDEYRCVAADLRNANGGQSSGPLEIDRPWDAYTDDQLGVMDHLGVDKFMVLGFCIGGPFIWNLLERAPDRVVAAVLAQPSGFRKEMPDLFYQNNITGWGPALVERRPEITMAMVDAFLTRMYRTEADFVFTVTRDFVRSCQTPILVLPDDIPAHPYEVAMETVMLAPHAEVSIYPWKEPKERIPLAVRQIRSFLRAHRPATASG